MQDKHENAKTAPGEDPRVMEYLKRAGLADENICELLHIGYFTAPAAKGHHLAEPGGLAIHSANVTELLLKLTDSLGIEWESPKCPYLIGMLHDLVKTRCYKLVSKDGEPPKYEYVQPAFPGHGACSAMIATSVVGTYLSEQVTAAITYHMGMFGVGREYTVDEFNAALKIYKREIIATHAADWWAARVTEEGAF